MGRFQKRLFFAKTINNPIISNKDLSTETSSFPLKTQSFIGNSMTWGSYELLFKVASIYKTDSTLTCCNALDFDFTLLAHLYFFTALDKCIFNFSSIFSWKLSNFDSLCTSFTLTHFHIFYNFFRKLLRFQNLGGIQFSFVNFSLFSFPTNSET